MEEKRSSRSHAPGSRVSWLAVSLMIAVHAIIPVAAQQPPIPEETRPDQMADLAARSLTVAPEYPLPGETAQVQLEIQNRAAHTTARVAVVVFADGKPLATREVTVAAQSLQTLTYTWTPPAAGVHTLSAMVDPGLTLTERDRIDNAISIEVVAAERPPAGAQLVVSTLETVFEPEQPGVLRATIRNLGKAPAAAPLVVRRDGMKAAVRLVGPIAPGGSVTVQIPWSRGPGRASAEINPRFGGPGGNKPEIRDAPDDRALADLRVEELSLHTARLQTGRPRTVTATFLIVNAGRRPVERAFRSRIDVVSATSDGPRPVYLTTNGLPGGGIAYVSQTIDNAPAEFDVRVTVDADDDISEADESNNAATGHFKNPAPDIDRWVSIGPRLVTGSNAHGYAWNDAVGRLSSIAIHPTSPSTMLVGAQSGGVWKTTDGGKTWNPVADAATVRVAALALAPDNPSRVYLVTPREGVFRSDDAGTSWVQVSTMDLDVDPHNSALLINPANTSELLVSSNQGVYRSANSGSTWQQTLSGGPATGLIRLPNNPRRVYAGIRNDDAQIAGVYHSFDGGVTWRIQPGCPGGTLPADDAKANIRLAVSGNQVFVAYRNSDPLSFRVFRTTDIGCSVGGITESSWEAGWNPTGTVGGAPIPAVLWSGMWADPTNANNVYLGGTYFWRSTNKGTSFTMTSGQGSPAGGAHVDHHNVATDPASANVIYSLNDGGIYRSTSRGASGTWTFVGKGITNVEFYDHASAALDRELVIGGTQDNGTIKTTEELTTWTMIRGGDGATVDIDPTDPKVMYSMGQYASSIARSTNGGGSWSGAGSGLPTGAVCYNLHFLIHPSRPQTLLAACIQLWRTTSSGGAWNTILTPAMGAISRSVVDGPGDQYYAGSTVGVISTARSGSGWTDVFTHPTPMGVIDLEVDLDNRAVLYASFGGTGARRVYRLTRKTTSPPAFDARDITSDLPVGRGVRALALDRNRPFTIHAGTDQGVFRGRSVDGGQTWFWTSYSNGMPPADVRDLDVHPGTGVMRAATFGRSAFEVNTDHPIGSVLAVQGKITFLRVHDVGTGFGPPMDSIDGEVVVRPDAEPLKALGFQLRTDAKEVAHAGMLDVLRDAFRQDRTIRIEYVRTGLRHGTILRVVRTQ